MSDGSSTHLARTATDVAVLTDDATADLPRTRRPGRRGRSAISAPAPRWSCSRPATTSPPWCLSRCAGRRARGAAGSRRARPHRVIDTYDPDVIVDATASTTTAAPAPHRPAPRPRAAAVHLGQHRLAEAGPAVAANLIANAGADRRLSRHPANRPGGNDIADVLLLRPVGDPQPPAARRRHHPHRSLGGRRRVLGAVPPPPRYHVRRRSPHLRPARPHRLRRHGPAPTCATSPRPAADSPPERVRRFAALGQRKGWQLFVMYGATEATARMAYLPPDLAFDTPTRSAGRSPAARSHRAASTGGPTTSASWSTAGPM